MFPSLAERFFLDRARGLIGWMLGLGAYCSLIIAFFPSIRASDNYGAVLEDYPDAFKEFFGGDIGFELTTGPGFINAQLFSLMVPLLLSIVAIGFGATIGTDQQTGLMDLLLANPVTRRRIVFERALAMVATLLILAGVVFVVVTIGGAIVDLGIGFNELAAATTATILVVLFHGLVALAIGAATGSRSMANGVTTVVFAAGYLLSSMAGIVEWLEPARVLSPFHHAFGPAPLFDGWAPANLTFLAALCLMALGAAAVMFERRDLV